MFYLIHGNDTYRSREKLREVIDAYRDTHQSGLSFFQIDLEEERSEDVEHIFGSSSLFPEKKLVVLKSASANKVFQQRFADSTWRTSLENDRDTIVIFFERREVPAANPLFTFVKKTSHVQKCDVLRGGEREKWVRRYLETRGWGEEPGTLEIFLRYTDSLDTWGTKNELDKIIRHTASSRITKDEIALFLHPSFEVTIFTMLDALGGRNKKRALAALAYLLEQGENESYVLSMMAYGFRNLLRVKSLGHMHASSFVMSKKLGFHPYVFRKTVEQARLFTLEELKKIYQGLARIDLEIKVGKVEPRLALEMFVASV